MCPKSNTTQNLRSHPLKTPKFPHYRGNDRLLIHRYHQHSPLGGHGRLGLGRSSQPQRFRRDHGTRSTAAGQVQQSSQVPTGGHGSAMSPPVHTRSWVGHNSTPSGGRPSATHSTNVAPPHWIHKTMDKHYTTYTNTNDHHLGQQLWQDKQQAYNSIWE